MTRTVRAGSAPRAAGRTPQLASFRACCEETAGRRLETAAALHDFSVSRPEDFWRLLLDWSGLQVHGDLQPVVTSDDVEHATFFPGLRLNYAENLLRPLPGVPDSGPAVTSVHADGTVDRLDRTQLRDAVRRTAAVLSGLDVGPNDRVVAIAPNHAGVLVAALATSACGAVLATATPDMGTPALLSRFAQVAPRTVLVDRGGMGPTTAAADAALADLVAGLPTVEHVLLLDAAPLPALPTPVHRLADLVAAVAPDPGPWPQLPFTHPLWVMFSSGTTGPPKAMVHSAGGALLEHVKEHRLHGDLDVTDVLYFHTSTAWMMWNWQLSALAVGAHIVLFDGRVSGPETLWQLVADQGVTVFGTSPAYLQLCQDEGYRPAEEVDLSGLRALLSTGAVLHDWQFDWIADAIGELPVQTISGGTDIVGCFVLGMPGEAVRPGRAQSLSLGLDVAAVDDQGHAVLDQVGDLVCRRPFPSRPTGLLHDEDGSRFHEAYFSQHPGMWTQGDRVDIDAAGSTRLHGRSDGVLNVDGIRIGPSEIYAILRPLPQVVDVMAVEQQDPGQRGGTRLVLLVVLRDGDQLDEELIQEIRSRLRREGSPAHVPAVLLAVEELPYTHNGKRSEAAARAALDGRPVRNRDALRNPGCLAALTAAAGPPHPVDRADGALLDDDLEDTVLRAFRDVLGTGDVTPDTDFFDAGGTSRRSMTLLRRLRIELGRPVPMDTFLDGPSARALSAALRQGPAPVVDHVETLRRGDPLRPPLFLVHGAYGDVDSYRALAGRLELAGAVLGLTAEIAAGDGSPRSVAELAAEHVERLDRQWPVGPVRLAGYSFGGLVAFEMARRLSATGREVDFLGLLDPAPPSASLTPLQRRLHGLGKRLALFVPGCADTTLRQVVVGRLRSHRLTPDSQALRRSSGVANQYSWGRYDGATTYFRATRRIPVVTTLLYVWRQVAPRLTVVDVRGAHHDLLREKGVEALARRVTAALPPDS